ncbi:MAG: recombinase family protein, partial [Clostridia bacterium]
TGGALPFGYAATAEGQLVPNDESWGGGHTAAEIVSLLFQHYVHVSEAEGRGLRAVCRWLNEQGIPSPTRARNGWNPTGIRQILRNPVYTGDYVWGKTSQPMHGNQTPRSPAEWVVAPGAHAALIDRALWDRAQSILDGNRTVSRARIQGTPDLLTGFVRCGLCGSLLTLRRPGSKNRYSYYTCGSRYNEARIRHETVCAFPFMRAEDLHQAVWGEVAALAADPRAVERALGPDDGETARRALASRIADARADIDRCNRDEGKLLDLALAETFRPEVVAGKLEAIRGRVREAQDRLVRLEREQRDLDRARPAWVRDPEQVRAYFVTLLAQGDLSVETRRQILGAVVGSEGVAVYPDGRCEIRIRLPVEAPEAAPQTDVSLAMASRHSLRP